MTGRNVSSSIAFGLLAAIAGLQSPGVAATPDKWSPAASLDKCSPPSPACASRSGHSATLLKDGKVLVVGGSLSPATAQIYNPADDSWAPTQPVKGGASLPTAARLPDGKVLLVAEGAPQLYDPDKGTWRAASAPPTSHTQGTATVLANGKVLLAGGLGGERGVAAASLYDPSTNSWAPTGPLIQIRSQHVATLLPDGKVLVTGGFSENYGPKRNTAELYDPQTGTWAPTGGLVAGVVGHTVTVLGDGNVLLAGGQREETVPPGNGGDRVVQLYDPQSGSWSTVAEMESGRSGHTATLLRDGTVLVTGGVAAIARRGGERPEDVTPTELYDPAAGVWTPAERPDFVRSEGHTATLLPPGPARACGSNCGKLLVIGGRGGLTPEGSPTTDKTAELYEAPPGTVSAPQPTSPPAAEGGADDAAAGPDADGNSSSIPLVAAVAVAVVVAGGVAFAVTRRRRARVG